MDRQVNEFFIGEFPLPCILHIYSNVPGALVMLRTALFNHAAELCVPLFRSVLQCLALKQSLGKVTQMNDKTVEIQ